ncbi:MAG: putative ABC transporter permease subunit [Thermodesulfobacteriota bacterium]
MKEILTLLKPRLWGFKNRGLSEKFKGGKVRLTLLATIGTGFWVGAFTILKRVLTYLRSLEGFGDILAYKLLSMALITFFSLLIFSSILTSLSKLYLSKDLSLVHSMPVSRQRIFFARWLESTLDSSWMVLLFSLPLFLSFGIVYQGGFFYYLTAGINLLPFCWIASSLSAFMVLLGALILPAGRLRSVFFFLSLFLFLLLLFSFRLTRPERFVNPESFFSLLVYLKNMETSPSPILPTTWFTDALKSALSGSTKGIFLPSALSWSGAISLTYFVTWIAGWAYFKGLSKAETIHGKISPLPGLKRWDGTRLLQPLPGPTRAFILKEIKTFFRDKTQWSQIFLVVALIVIYLYNFSVLPLDKTPIGVEYLQNLLSFLNMGLVAFVLSAVSARFAFPAISLEGDSFWIVKSSPVSIRTFLWIKFLIYFLPLLFLSEVLVVVTNLFLHVTPFMMVLSTLTIFLKVPGIVSMGIGLGALYPDFHSETPTQSVTSLGGLIYMTFCIGFIGLVIVLEAGPVYHLFMSGIRQNPLSLIHWLWAGGSFALILFLCFLTVWMPMRLGEKRLLQGE